MNILKQFDTVSVSEDGAWLHLCLPGSDDPAYADPGEDTKPLRIKLKGPDSEIWTAFQRKAMRQGNKDEKRTAHQIALDDSQLFAKMTMAWENFPEECGECTFENATKVYLNYKDIRLQALRFVMKQENFTQALLSA